MPSIAHVTNFNFKKFSVLNLRVILFLKEVYRYINKKLVIM